MRTFDDLVRAGKIRYAGLSDVPGWYWAQTLALLAGGAGDRDEHVPMGQALVLGTTAWSPPAGGFLTGKYRDAGGGGRFADPAARSWTEREWQLPREVAGRLGVTRTRVAVDWVATRPGIASAIAGAGSAEQPGASTAALDFEPPADLRAVLDEASAVPPVPVYRMFTPAHQNRLVNPRPQGGRQAGGLRPGAAQPGAGEPGGVRFRPVGPPDWHHTR